MTNLADVADLPVIEVWDGIRARRIEGDQLTVAVVELGPDAVVPEHTHPAEQNGLVIRGLMRFRVGDEERTLGPGGTWRILAGVPHTAQAGPEGAIVIDTFAPPRHDWDALPTSDPEPPRWP